MMISKIEKLQQQIHALQNNYLDRLPLTNELVDLSKIQFGDKSTEYAIALNDLAGIYRHLSQFEKAEPLFIQAADILSQTLGAKDPNTTTVLNNLAGLYRLTKNFTQAEGLFLAVIESYQSTVGDTHFLTLSAKNNLGLVYQDMHRYDDALQLHQTCLNALESQKQEHPIAYATTLSNIASVYGQTDKIDKAIEISQAVLTLYQKQVGVEHPLYANALNNLASLYYQIEDFTEAKALFLQAKTVNLKVFGSESDVYKSTLSNIAQIDHKLEKIAADKSTVISKSLIDDIVNSLLTFNHKTEEQRQANGFGMNLCRRYFDAVVFPAMQKAFSVTELEQMAMGLVGEGSECFGFDDEYSQDHDFGPRIMVWLTEDDYLILHERLQKLLNTLPKRFEGYEIHQSEWGQTQSAIYDINKFYQRYLGFSHPPQTLNEWRIIPESYLAAATNGCVFYDPSGKFSKIRNHLLQGYPQDIRLKKISARLMTIAQAGQYNFQRSLKRHDLVATNASSAAFIDASISLIFLLNNRYKPFYKWMHKAMQPLPILGNYSYHFFNNFLNTPLELRSMEIEKFCAQVIVELKRQNLSDHSSDFLLDHGPIVLQKIQDLSLKQSNPWVE